MATFSSTHMLPSLESSVKPRYSSSFSIENILRSTSPGSSPKPTSFSSDPVVSSSVSPTPSNGLYYQQTEASDVTLVPGGVTFTQAGQHSGAFHTHLPSIVAKTTSTVVRCQAQKRPRSRDQEQDITPANSSPTSSESSAASSSTRWSPGSDLEEGNVVKRLKSAHLETSSPHEDEDDRDTLSPTDSTSRSNSSSPLSDAPSGERRKKNRTSFTTEQVAELEATFLHYRYLASPERSRMSRRLDLSEQQIKTWFQNRRMKEKRHVKGGGDQLLIANVGTSVLTPALMTSYPLTPQHVMTSSHPQYAPAPLSPTSPPTLMAHLSGSPPLMTQHAAYPGFPTPHQLLPAHVGHHFPMHQHQQHHHTSSYATAGAPYTTLGASYPTQHLTKYAPEYAFPGFHHHLPMPVMMQ